MSPEKLEQQANILLYGVPAVIESAEEREVILAWLYMPSRKPIVYTLPKQVRWQLKCGLCGRLRHDNSGQVCAYCHRTRARTRYLERIDGWTYLNETMRGGLDDGGNPIGIAWPETEWYDRPEGRRVLPPGHWLTRVD